MDSQKVTQAVTPAKAGVQTLSQRKPETISKNTGFRVKPGMTEEENHDFLQVHLMRPLIILEARF
jgi:hypothetical protein